MSVLATVLDSNKENLFKDEEELDEYVYDEWTLDCWVPSKKAFRIYCLGFFQDEEELWFQGYFRNAEYVQIVYYQESGHGDDTGEFKDREKFLDLLRSCTWSQYFTEDMFYKSGENEYTHVFDLNKMSWTNVILAVSLARMGWENHEAGEWAVQLSEEFPDMPADHVIILACNTAWRFFYGSRGKKVLQFGITGGRTPGHMTFKLYTAGILQEHVIKELTSVLESLPAFKSYLNYDNEMVDEDYRAFYGPEQYYDRVAGLVKNMGIENDRRRLALNENRHIKINLSVKEQVQPMYDYLRGV